jgi:Ca2+-binding EF-hand superfamily protein
MTTIGGGALTQQLYQKLFDRLDVDSSQGLSLNELKAADPTQSDDAFGKIFAGLDADQDGKIGRAEIAAGPALALRNDPLLAPATPADEASAAARAAVEDLFKRADTDGDGKLSADEMEAEKALRRAANLDAGHISGPIFATRDADGDGALDPSEVTGGSPIQCKVNLVFYDEMPPEAQAQWRKEFGRAPDIYTPEEKQRRRDELAAQQAEHMSGPAETFKFSSGEIGGLRGDASAQFSTLAMTKTLSSRLLAQILGGLDAAPATA